MSKFCQKCGNELKDEAKFCDKCGVKTSISENYEAVNNRPVKKKNGCLIVILLFVILGLIGAFIVSMGQGNNNGHAKDKEIEKESNDVILGAEGAIGDLTLIVNSVNESEKIDIVQGMLSYTPDSGKYAIINVTIKNNTKDSKQLLLNYFKLVGPDEAKYVPTIIADTENKYIAVDVVNPNLDITGNLVFEIPKDLAPTDCLLRYSDFDFTSGISTFLLK